VVGWFNEPEIPFTLQKKEGAMGKVTVTSVELRNNEDVIKAGA